MWEIYSIGNSTFLIEVFRGIARLWSSNDIYVLLSIALLLGLIWNSLLWAIDQDKAPFPAKGFILSIIFVLMLLGPQSLVDVRITSKRDMSFQEVHNVPLLPALGGWLVTNSGTAIADLMAQAFSIVGIANTWDAFSPIQNFVGLDEANYASACTPNPTDSSVNVCKTFKSYLEDCYVTASMISPNAVKPIDDVINAMPRDLMVQLKVENPKIYSTSYLVAGNPNGEKLTCPTAWTKLNAAMNGSAFKAHLKKRLIAQGVDLEKVDVFLQQNSMQGVLPDAESSFELANLAFAKSIFADYFPDTKYGRHVSRAMFDTVRQRQVSNATKKEFWMENAEVMQSFFEALTVFLTPFLGLTLAVSGQGVMAVGQYFAAWVFVQLWSVMIVLVNLFTALAMTNRFTSSVLTGQHQFSLAAIDSQFATANSYISISGMLYTFIPAICVFVLYRGVHAMQGMAKQAMADPSINAQRLSPDTGATIKDGNGNFGNHTAQYQNNTGEYNHGDSLVSTSMGKVNVGGSATSGLSAGMAQLQSQSQSKAASAQKSLDQAFSNNAGSSHDFNDTNQSSFVASNASEWASSAAKAISDTGAMTYKEAQQLVASGAVTADAGGALGIGGKVGSKGMFASYGAKFGADLKASVGLGTDASETAQRSYQKNLQNAQNHSDKINANLSKIHTGGEITASSNSDGFQKSVKDAAAFSRQSQALSQQSDSIGSLLSDSKTISSSQEVDMAGASSALKNQSIGDYLQQQNPELWEQIKNSNVNGMSGEKYLQQQEAMHMGEASRHAVNPGGDARAQALMDLVKANDAIDVKSIDEGGGVDLNKEKQDAQTNQGIFNALSNSGISNTGAAAAFYDKKAEVLSHIDDASKSFDKTNNELEQASPKIPSANQFSQDAKALKVSTANSIATGEAIAENGRKSVVADHADNMTDIGEKGTKLTKGNIGGVSEAKSDALNNSMEQLKEGQHSNQSTLDLTKGVIPELTDTFKSGGEAAFNNLVEHQTLNKADTSSYRPEYAQAAEALSQLSTVETGSMNDRLTSRNDDKVENAQSMIAMLNDDKLMTSILGKNEDGSYGKGSDFAKDNFDTNTLSQIEEGAKWLQSYKNGDEVQHKAIDKAINKAESSSGDGAKTYLSAMQNLGLAREASNESDGKVFSSITEQSANDLQQVLDKQKTGGSNQYLLTQVTGGTELTSGTVYSISGDRDTVRDEYSNKIDAMEKMAGRMEHLLTPEQNDYIDNFIGQARDRINLDDGDRPNQKTGGKDDSYMNYFSNQSAGGRE